MRIVFMGTPEFAVPCLKSLIIAAFMVFSFFATLNAEEKGGCVLAQTGSVDVSWTGYKTQKKVGVNGTFDKVAYTPAAKEGENFRSILVGSSVVIDSSSVNSKHADRDAKLAKFFFGMMNGKNINANGEFKDDRKSLLHDYISVEELSACTTCNACVQECPVSINPLDIILQLRRYLVMEESNTSPEWAAMFSNVENNFAPWKFSPEERDKWVEELK